MVDETNCPVCGSVLATDVPGGLCPACLLRQGLAGDESEPSIGDIEGVFEPCELNAPASSNGKNGAISRLLLRDVCSGDLPCPAISPRSAEMPSRGQHGDRYQLLGEIARGGTGGSAQRP